MRARDIRAVGVNLDIIGGFTFYSHGNVTFEKLVCPSDKD